MDYRIIHLGFEKGANSIFLNKEKNGPYHLFSLYLEGDWFPILSLTLIPALEPGYWETHVSELDRKHRRQGYGKAIYYNAFVFAVHNKMKLCSSPLASKSAKRVWKSLMKDNNIKYSHGRFWYNNEINGSGSV